MPSMMVGRGMWVVVGREAPEVSLPLSKTLLKYFTKIHFSSLVQIY